MHMLIFHSLQFWRHSVEKLPFRSGDTQENWTRLSGDNPQRSGLPPPPPQEPLQIHPPAWVLSSCRGTGPVSRNPSLALKTEFLFKRAEGSSTPLHLILLPKRGGAFTQPLVLSVCPARGDGGGGWILTLSSPTSLLGATKRGPSPPRACGSALLQAGFLPRGCCAPRGHCRGAPHLHCEGTQCSQRPLLQRLGRGWVPTLPYY